MTMIIVLLLTSLSSPNDDPLADCRDMFSDAYANEWEDVPSFGVFDTPVIMQWDCVEDSEVVRSVNPTRTAPSTGQPEIEVNWQDRQESDARELQSMRVMDRMPVNYDQVALPEPVQVTGFDYMPFFDWVDFKSFIQPGMFGYVRDDMKLFEMGIRASDEWLVNKQEVSSVMDANVLIWFGTVPVSFGGRGGTLFICNSQQRVFFQVFERLCPSCVEFLKIDELPDHERANIRVKLKYMRTDHRDIVGDHDYDMAIRWIRGTDTWNEQGRHTLSSLTDDIRKGYAGNDFEYWMASLFLLPERLKGAKLIGPNVSVTRVSEQVEIPDWVRMQYCEYINSHVGWSCAAPEIIERMWRQVERQCPECETWSDWRCGSGYEVEYNRSTNELWCQMVDPDDDRGLMPHNHLPGDRSPNGSMIYDFGLRVPVTDTEYTRRLMPQPDPYLYVLEENIAHYEEINDASIYASNYYGTTWTAWTDQEIRNMAMKRTARMLGELQETVDRSESLDVGERPAGVSVTQIFGLPEGEIVPSDPSNSPENSDSGVAVSSATREDETQGNQ